MSQATRHEMYFRYRGFNIHLFWRRQKLVITAHTPAHRADLGSFPKSDTWHLVAALIPEEIREQYKITDPDPVNQLSQIADYLQHSAIEQTEAGLNFTHNNIITTLLWQEPTLPLHDPNQSAVLYNRSLFVLRNETPIDFWQPVPGGTAYFRNVPPGKYLFTIETSLAEKAITFQHYPREDVRFDAVIQQGNRGRTKMIKIRINFDVLRKIDFKFVLLHRSHGFVSVEILRLNFEPLSRSAQRSV
jgi:hypothetical protein